MAIDISENRLATAACQADLPAVVRLDIRMHAAKQGAMCTERSRAPDVAQGEIALLGRRAHTERIYGRPVGANFCALVASAGVSVRGCARAT